MAIDIMDLLKSQLGGQIAGQLGKQFGESEQAAQSGISAMIPTILGGLLKQVSAPGGAEKLDKTITEGGYDGGLLDNLSGMLTGGTGSTSNKGGDLVSMIFGDKAAILGPILAKLTGLKAETVSSMLAMLLPLVMSFLGKQKKSMGLDANGLASMLMSQKESIGAALPAGISDAMGLGALGIAGPSAAKTSAPAPAPASSPAAAPSGGLAKVLVPLAVLAAIGFGAYQYIFAGIRPTGPEGNVVVESAGLQELEVSEEAAPVEVPSVDAMVKSAEEKVADLALPAIGEMPDLSSMLGSMTGALEKITDVDSAKAALPELESMQQKFESVTSGFSAMPDAMKGKLGEAMKGMMPDLQAMIDKVMAIPGVKEILQPIIDKVLASAKTLSA